MEPGAALLPEVTTFLQSTWQDVLNLPDVSPDDNFLQLGGDSIAAVLCLNQIRAKFGIDIPIETLLGDPLTLDGVARAIVSRAEPAAR